VDRSAESAELAGAARLLLHPDACVLPQRVREALAVPLPAGAADEAGRRAADACSACFATDRMPAAHLHVDLSPPTEAEATLACARAAVPGGGGILDLALRRDDLWGRAGEWTIVRPPLDTFISPESAALDHDRVAELLAEHRPALLIAGGDRCPRLPDWERLGETCRDTGCLLLAELGGAAGLVAAGACPSPIGHADIVTIATGTTLCGPPGAAVLSTRHDLARRISRALSDRGHAPSGPHPAALAGAFGRASDDEFIDLQRRIVANARRVTDALCEAGVPVIAGGTGGHLCVVEAPQALSRCLGALRLNADTHTLAPSTGGAPLIALGLTWLTQQGATEDQAAVLGEVLGQAAQAVGAGMDVATLAALEERVTELAAELGVAPSPSAPSADSQALLAEADAHLRDHPLFGADEATVLILDGDRAGAFLDQVATGRVAGLARGECAHTFLLQPDLAPIDDVLIAPSAALPAAWLICAHATRQGVVAAWLRGLAEGCLPCEAAEGRRRLDGPVRIREVGTLEAREAAGREEAGLPDWSRDGAASDGLSLFHRGHRAAFGLRKPFFVGQEALEAEVDLPRAARGFEPPSRENEGLRETPLIGEHERLGGRLIDFEGWRMPVWYTSIAEEHAAVREGAGLFDIGHMGLIEVSGARAVDFLEAAATNRAAELEPGCCHYTFLLAPDGLPLDDIIVCRAGEERFIMVVNASNARRVWSWLTAVVSGEVAIDRDRPHIQVDLPVSLRDLTDESAGDDRLTGMALQGPSAAPVMDALLDSAPAASAARSLSRFRLCRAELGGIPAVISRTGYTGEEIGYELFVHPDHAANLWRRILELGRDLGVRPAGLGARDSTRVEVGLPLFGHELAGPHGITPVGAGYGRFVRLDKPFFIGRSALLERERERTARIVRFRLDDEGARAIRAGDPVASHRGELIGWVTSCALAGDRQIGMAWLEERAARVGSRLLLFPSRQAQRSRALADLEALSVGDRLPVQESATVVPRFPR